MTNTFNYSKYTEKDYQVLIDNLKDLHENVKYRFGDLPKSLSDNWSFEIIESKDYPDYIKNPKVLNYNFNKVSIRESSKVILLKREDYELYLFFNLTDLKAIGLMCHNNKIEKIGELDLKHLITPMGYCSYIRSIDQALDLETDLEYLVLS